MSGPGAACAVTWWGHAAATVSLGGVQVVTDPLLRRRVGPLHNVGWLPPAGELAAVDAVLLSHLHRDHTDLPSLTRFPARTRVVVPAGAGRLVGRHVRGRVDELAVGDAVDLGGVSVLATPAAHDGRRGRTGPPAAAVGYVLAGARAAVYVAGDTDVFPAMADVAAAAPSGVLDLALVPVGGWGLTLGAGHLDPARAAAAVRLLRPRVAVPVHWGTLRLPALWRLRPDRCLGPGPCFAQHVARGGTGTRVAVLRPGERYAVPLPA